MTLHFVHVGKTGGTAIKRALRSNRLAYWRPDQMSWAPETPYGKIQLHNHSFGLDDVPEGDFAIFCLRDPVTRFLSAFYSRLNKGQPRYYFEWTEAERRAFERFPTPQALAGALASSNREERMSARRAARRIRHMRSMHRQVGTPAQLYLRRRKIVYIARQETLAQDWQQIKALLELPADVTLPRGSKRAHRQDPSLDMALDENAVAALRAYYRNDYRLLAHCDRLRAWHGWGVESRGLARARALPAVLPPLPTKPRWL